MKLKFYKSIATGNDFVILDNFTQELNADYSTLSKKLCDRKRGVGADGLLIISQSTNYDFEMIYFNSDGSGPVMCGNGARASINFVDKNLFKKTKYSFMAPDGIHQGQVSNNDDINITINEGKGEIEKVDRFREKPVYLTNTGVPHLVIQINDNFETLDIEKYAPALRKKHNANVNFIQKVDQRNWKIRTYERGVEGETLACGTGVTAAGLIVVNEYNSNFPLTFQARGGSLKLNQEANAIWLGGNAEIIFSGTIEL